MATKVRDSFVTPQKSTKFKRKLKKDRICINLEASSPKAGTDIRVDFVVPRQLTSADCICSFDDRQSFGPLDYPLSRYGYEFHADGLRSQSTFSRTEANGSDENGARGKGRASVIIIVD